MQFLVNPALLEHTIASVQHGTCGPGYWVVTYVSIDALLVAHAIEQNSYGQNNCLFGPVSCVKWDIM